MPILCVLAVLIMIATVYKYMNAYLTGKFRASKLVFVVGIIFGIISLSLLITVIITYIFYCNNLTLFHISINIGTQLYAMQHMMILGIFYFRLYSIFKGSVMCLTKCTHCIFGICYIFGIGLAILAAFTYSNDLVNSSTILGIAGIFILIATILLLSLYAYKLLRCYYLCLNNGDEYIAIITKVSLLVFASISMSLFTLIATPLSFIFNSVHWEFTRDCIFVIDISTNFVSIFLSYKYFNDYYQRLCGCCDSKCQQLCTKCFINKNMKTMVEINELSAKTAK